MDHLVLVGVARLLLLLLRGRANLAGDESSLMEKHLRRIGAVVRGAGVADHWRGSASLLLAVNNWRHVVVAPHLGVTSRGFRLNWVSVAQFSFAFWHPNHTSMF